jgi:hypothetical protein
MPRKVGPVFPKQDIFSWHSLPGVAQRPPRQTPFMNLTHMTRQEIETLLRLLADMKREELTLLMRWRIKSELMGRVY